MKYRYKPQPGKPLTPAEVAMMQRIVDGLNIKAISYATGKSPSTISTHLSRARLKLGAKTAEQAAVFFDRQLRQQA